MRTRWPIITLLLAGVVALGGCAGRTTQLQRIAKDWCLTIRAGQVLPVYPLTEDVRPGDVFIVPTPLSQQARIYEERGFLPLDQLLTRLRPGEAPPLEDASWAAFPSYTFEVRSGGGLSLALPLRSAPLGLSLLDAAEATGSVVITEAYTYGLDIATLHADFLAWWEAEPAARAAMRDVARSADTEVFLRVINRVYLAGGVTVSLVAGQARSAEAVAATPDEEEALAATLEALGPSLRVEHVGRRALSMAEAFPRPLVIGYLGFDVKVYASGELSPPIPSFAVLGRQASFDPRPPLSHCEDPESERIAAWLESDPEHRRRLAAWLAGLGLDTDLADIPHSCEHAVLRKLIVCEFGI